MADMITRCPKCDTAFRITDVQLSTAKGAVRCGACLHIFKALDHIVPGKTAPAQTAKPTKPAPPNPAPKAIPKTTPAAKPASPAPARVAPQPAATKPAVSPPSQIRASTATIKKAADFPKFEYKKPTTSVSSAAAAPRTAGTATEAAPRTTTGTAPRSSASPAKAPKDAAMRFQMKDNGRTSKAVDDTIFDEDLLGDAASDSVSESNSVVHKTKVDEKLGLENMLRFDQSAIDSDEIETFAVVDEDDLLISDDLPLDDDEDEPRKIGAYGDDLGESFIDLDKWKPQEKSIFDREFKAPKENEDKDQQKKSQTDESWAIDLLDSDDDDDDKLHFAYATPSPLEMELEDDFDFDDDNSPVYSRATTGSFNALDDSDIEQALGEPLSEHIEPNRSDRYDNTDDDAHSGYRDDDSHEEDYDYYDDERQDRNAMLRGIQPEPVEFDEGSYGINWKPKLIWGGLVTALSLILVLQVAWLQFEKLSRAAPYRGLYETFCPVFGCQVPPMSATNLIRTTNFLVRQHPEASGALMVDTIILNTAPFAQPFPDLVLAFSNLQGKTVASRRFTPAEYLSGELAGQKSMPSNRPVHLALEIVNPGPDAVNYAAYIP